MKALKVLVIFMSVLLAGGLALLGYGVATKLHRPASVPARPAADRPAAPAAERPDTFGTIAVPLPAGARVAGMAAAGDRVVLHLTGGGSDRLLVLNPATGTVAGTFVLAPPAAGGAQ